MRTEDRFEVVYFPPNGRTTTRSFSTLENAREFAEADHIIDSFPIILKMTVTYSDWTIVHNYATNGEPT